MGHVKSESKALMGHTHTHTPDDHLEPPALAAIAGVLVAVSAEWRELQWT